MTNDQIILLFFLFMIYFIRYIRSKLKNPNQPNGEYIFKDYVDELINKYKK